ncbi:RrF2 family transcriptional regulator [Phragmitibacter flavus]|nr:Rrf2 family transcriptional regulator [Phragmitibacter flavus]
MKISKKAEYALRAMLAICRSAPGTTFSIQTLAHDERIPLKFLEQILLILRKGGILHSRRGAGGGYQLAKPAAQITIGEILHLVDGPLDILPGSTTQSPALQSAFMELQQEMLTWLTNTTITDILQKEQTQGAVNFEI